MKVLFGPYVPKESLHGSTLFVGALLTGLLLLANVPGKIVRPIDNGRPESGNETFFVEHGWPRAFLRRTAGGATRGRIDRGDVLGGSVTEDRERLARVEPKIFWTLCDDVEKFSITWLAADTLVAGAILAAAVTAYEAWRRRSRRAAQFYLIELLFFVTVAAVLCSWFTVQMRERDEEQSALRQMPGILHDESLTGPQWPGGPG